MQDILPKTTSSRVIDFFSMAEDSGVPVVRFPLPETSSMSIQAGNTGIIGLDNSKQMTAAEEQSRVGHELGHCLYGGFYTRVSPYDIAEQHEARADKWYILHAIPKNDLFSLLREGYDAWEIAEILNTTEEYVRRAYYYYKYNA